MPELRHDLAADTVDIFHDALPTLQRLAMEIGHGGVHGRNRIIDRGAFGDDQAGFVFGPASIVGRDLGAGYAAWRLRTGHGGHDHTVRPFEALEREGLDRKSVV